MADSPPEYQMREHLGAGPSPGLHGLQAPSMPVVADTSSTWKALSAFGEQLGKTAVMLGAARDQTEALTASSEYTKRLEEIQDKWAASPDYTTARDKFKEERNALQMELSENISNDAVRQKAVLEWERAGVIAANRVNMAALRTEKNAVDDAIKVQAPAALKTYSQATSVHEQAAAVDSYVSTVKDAAVSGWIDYPTAVGMVRDFGVKADVADATNLIKADPVVAQHALLESDKFPTLDAGQRGVLVRTAQDTLTAQEKQVDAAPVREAFSQFAEGKLTPAWLAGQGAALPYATQRLLTAAISAPPATTTDPNMAWQLLARGNVSTDETVAAAADARASGKITDPMLQQMVSTAAQAEAARTEVPWLSGVRGEMIAALKPSDTQQSDSAIQQLGAVAEFDKFIAENPTAGEFEARAEAARLARVSRSTAAFSERFATPVPRFATVGPQDLTREKLMEAAARTLQASDSKWLTDDELVEQVDLMRGWDDIINREGKD